MTYVWFKKLLHHMINYSSFTRYSFLYFISLRYVNYSIAWAFNPSLLQLWWLEANDLGWANPPTSLLSSHFSKWWLISKVFRKLHIEGLYYYLITRTTNIILKTINKHNSFMVFALPLNKWVPTKVGVNWILAYHLVQCLIL